MKRPIWFKAKNYGYGWYPATWQGWLIMAIWLALLLLNLYRIDSVSHSSSDTLINFVPQSLILTLILVAVSYWAGEKPRWRWGKDDK
ncbi:hypothetical protein K8R04_04600 [Candidatus Uhrbacteria bacterium]|nr:hypothetical protein [Candidatus Uhrbacteria bacterium]